MGRAVRVVLTTRARPSSEAADYVFMFFTLKAVLSTRRHPAHLSLARLITVADTAESPAAAAAGGGRSILIYTCFRRQRLGLTLASFFFFFF